MMTLPIAGLLIARFAGGDVMAAVAGAIRNFSHAVAPLAVTALWQGAMVAAGLALCLRFAPRVAAAHRFAAWAAGFAALMALPFAPMLARMIASNAAPNNTLTSAASLGSLAVRSLAARPWLEHPWLQMSDGWCVSIAAVWILVALARAADLAIHSFGLRRLWQDARPVAMDEALRAALTAGNGGWPPKFELCKTRDLDRPSVIGFLAPRILIPEWLFESLTRQEVEQVVLHEAEHLRRRDDWTNLLQKLCLVVFPLNPALAFVERRLCREREMACDEGVVRRTQAPRAYAACLAGLAERGMQRRAEALTLGARAGALTLGAFERRPELAQRVHSILLRRGAMNPVAGRAMLGALGCMLAIGAVELARCPQLVAFVPAQPEVTMETPQMLPSDFVAGQPAAPVSMSSIGTHYQPVSVVATAPEAARRGATTGHKPAPAPATAPHAWQTKSVAPRLSAMNQTRPAGADLVFDQLRTNRAVIDWAASGAPIPQELIVLTAFERVQASSDELGDRVIRDSGSGTAANTYSDGGSAGRVTVTRVIFRIYPADRMSTNSAKAVLTSAAQSGAATAPANSVGRNPAIQGSSGDSAQKPWAGQPMPIPLGNGWFVIQL